MCGIAALLGESGGASLKSVQRALRRRGPDYDGVAEVTSARLVVLAAVLHVRGATVCEQPVVDSASGNVLAWNGELYDGDDGDAGSDDGEEADTARLSALLNGAGAADDLVARIASLRGPWALVFWHEASRTLWWGRDRTGRRSLLVRFAGSDSGDGERAVHTGVMLSSVAGAAPRAAEHDAGAAAFWSPVRPDGLYCARRLDGGGYTVALHPWRPVTPRVPRGVTTRTAAADELHRLLRHALRLRVRSRSSALRARSDAAVSSSDDAAAAAAAAPLGVLFSGGLDSMVVAALASEALARDGAPRSPIELINVCFDHPRHASPDRLASIAGVLELSRRHPARVWRLVLVDATFDDVTSVGENGAMQRAELARLIAPRTTHMDLTSARRCGTRRAAQAMRSRSAAAGAPTSTSILILTRWLPRCCAWRGRAPRRKRRRSRRGALRAPSKAASASPSQAARASCASSAASAPFAPIWTRRRAPRTGRSAATSQAAGGRGWAAAAARLLRRPPQRPPPRRSA